jgi:opacity protein-like surface antigen
MYRNRFSAAAALLASLLFSSSSQAQTETTVIAARTSVVLEAPRGDSVTLGEVPPGTILEVLEVDGDWYRVSAPASDEPLGWESGWMHVDAFLLPDGERAAGDPGDAAGGGRFMVRGFGYAGGLMFSASDSFETILGDTFNTVFGGGGQVVFPNGVFAQASFDRTQSTGTRAFVSGSQVFTLDIPNRVTVTPVLVTGGYRSAGSGRVAPYFGGGVGWYTLEESSPTLPATEPITSRHTGYHVLGGAEFPLARWIWIAGEAQWATVPKALGDTGISAVFDETDLGGISFRFKVMIGY